VPGQPPRITPLSLLRNVTAGGAGGAAWPRDLLEAIMAVIAQAERAMPSSAQLLMSTVSGALAAVFSTPLPPTGGHHGRQCAGRARHALFGAAANE